jgi:hypothetical protein
MNDEKRSIEGRMSRFKSWFLTKPAHIQAGVALGTLLVVGFAAAVVYNIVT